MNLTIELIPEAWLYISWLLLLPVIFLIYATFPGAWIKKNYNRDSVVIYPPVDTTNFKLYQEKEEFYLCTQKGTLMGIEKSRMEEGYSSCGDLTVCSSCFGNKALKEYIDNYGASIECSFCENTVAKSCYLNSVVSHIVSSIYQE